MNELHSIEWIAPNTWRIDEGGMVNLYLLVGEKRALLIDTGCGAGYLPNVIAKCTTKPLIVAVTHRHPDHCGGAWMFGSYYAHPADIRPEYDAMCLPVISRRMVEEAGYSITHEKPLFKRTRVIPMNAQQSFDLGGRIVEVQSVPGHTKGSVMFVDETNHLLFTGDAINPSLWMHLTGCTTLVEWLDGALQITSKMKSGTYTAWYGHGDGRQSLAQMEETVALVRKIINEKKEGTLPSGKHLYPGDQAFPNVFYSSSKID